MVAEIRHSTVTVPTGHTPASPFGQAVNFPSRIVRRIDWKVPPGPMGQMGWRLTMSGIVVLPTNSDLWVVVDGKDGTWEVDGYPDSGAWGLSAYNTGTYPHNVYLAFYLDLPEKPDSLRSSIPAYEIYPGPSLENGGPPVVRR